LRVTDIAATVALARAAGALVAVDNTFLSPVLQQPLSFGADIVVHSTTKYLNGHSDVVGGAVIAATPERHTELAWWANATGVTGSAFDSYMVLRGIRTLHARMAIHESNAGALAAWLEGQRGVRRVLYPGLRSHPGHALARAQQKGFGAIITLELEGGGDAVRRFLEAVKLFSLAESLGGVESLVAHPSTMTHAAMTPEARAAAGLSDGLLRLSVGIEALPDLQRDLAAGLAALS
jgi:cystathionine gamma-synthase